MFVANVNGYIDMFVAMQKRLWSMQASNSGICSVYENMDDVCFRNNLKACERGQLFFYFIVPSISDTYRFVFPYSNLTKSNTDLTTRLSTAHLQTQVTT